MRLLHAVGLLSLGILLGLGAKLAWGAALELPGSSELGCPAPGPCTLHLGTGHWIVYAPKGQVVRQTEINNETGILLETQPP